MIQNSDCFQSWTITQERYLATKSSAVGSLVIFWMFAYSPCYNMGYNALTYTFLVGKSPCLSIDSKSWSLTCIL